MHEPKTGPFPPPRFPFYLENTQGFFGYMCMNILCCSSLAFLWIFPLGTMHDIHLVRFERTMIIYLFWNLKYDISH